MQWTILFNSFAFVLSLVYSLISLVALFQICKIIYYRHNIFHFQFVFLVHCFCWGIVRAFFWLFVPWDNLPDLCINGSGLIIQFWTFSLLVLYFIQMIYKIQETWNQRRIFVFAIFFVSNAIFIASFIASGVGLYFSSKSEWMEQALAFFVAFMYLVLSLLLAFFGWKLMTLINTTKTKVPFLRGRMWLAGLSASLFVVFFSRAIKDCLSGFGIGIITTDPTHMDLKDQIATFSLMFIWDIIPAVLVILIFWHIPSSPSHLPIPSSNSSSTRTRTERVNINDDLSASRDENSQEFIFSPNHTVNTDDDLSSSNPSIYISSPKKLQYTPNRKTPYQGYNTTSVSPSYFNSTT